MWYVDRSAGAEHEWRVAAALDELAGVPGALWRIRSILRAPAREILPFFEVMGTWPGGQKEFWWERDVTPIRPGRATKTS